MSRARSPLRLLIAILTLLVLSSAPVLRAQDSSDPTGFQSAQSEEHQVWVNTATGIYHYPGDKVVWTHQTREVHEREGCDCSGISSSKEWAVKIHEDFN
jgi:hypothetical protein